MVNVVRLPFKSRGVQYRSGDLVTSPGGIALFNTKLKDGIIVTVDEHNIDRLAQYLEHRRGVENAKELLQGYLDAATSGAGNPKQGDKYNDPEYIDKVMKLAEKYNIETEGKNIKTIVEELKTING